MLGFSAGGSETTICPPKLVSVVIACPRLMCLMLSGPPVFSDCAKGDAEFGGITAPNEPERKTSLTVSLTVAVLPSRDLNFVQGNTVGVAAAGLKAETKLTTIFPKRSRR